MKSFAISPLSSSHLEGVAELERLCFAEPWSQQALALLLQDKNLGVVKNVYVYTLSFDVEKRAYNGQNLSANQFGSAGGVEMNSVRAV